MLTGNKGWETIASAKWIKADSSFLMCTDEEGGAETNCSGFIPIDVITFFESGEVTWEKLKVGVSSLEVWTICVWLDSTWVFEVGEVTWGELNEVFSSGCKLFCTGSIWVFETGEVTWGELNAEVSPLEVWNVNVWLGLIWIERKLFCTGDTGCGENLTGTSM